VVSGDVAMIELEKQNKDLQSELIQLRKVCDEFADRLKRVRPIVTEDGSCNDWIDCHLDNMLHNYNNLPHVKERNEK
jgi:hypothetical protein